MKLVKTFGGVFTNRAALSVAAVSMLSTAIVVAAVNSDGATATNVQLDDGAVWVTNEAQNAIGRLNVRIDELDAQLKGPGAGLDVLQDGRTVLFTGHDGGVQRVDVYTVQPTGSNEIPIVNYQIGGGVGAVYDPATGNLWTGAAEQLVAPEYPEKPDAIVDSGSHLIVTTAVPQTQIDNVTDGNEAPRGRVVLVNSSGWYEVPLGSDLKPLREGDDQPADSATTGDAASATGSVATTADSSATSDSDTAGTDDTGDSSDVSDTGDTEDEDTPDPILQLAPGRFATSLPAVDAATAVGGHIIALFDGNQVVFDDHEPIEIPGEQVQLQQVGDDATEVVVASSTGLYALSLDEAATLTELATAQGTPSAPVVVNGCRYGAWSNDTPQWVRWCGPDQIVGPSRIPQAQKNSTLVWRVNGNNVVLNSTGNGDLWADHDGSLAYTGNWDELDNIEDLDEPTEADGEGRQVEERRCIDGGAEAPISGDDAIGVRPRQTLLDVLYNDDDLNCEPISITNVEPSSGTWGALTVVDNGQHLLFSPSDEFVAEANAAVTSFQFSYSAVDAGGNTSAPANVTVEGKAASIGNRAPELRPKSNGKTREMRTVVEEGQSVSYNVMADWWDPDGDDLRLVSAFPAKLGEASTTPDGLVRFAANGVAPGVQDVNVTMSDGIAESDESLEVTIKPTGSALPPITENDFATVAVGSKVSIAPLANDSDPNEDPLSLQANWPNKDGRGFTAKVDDDVVELSGVKPGVYRLAYRASDGDQATRGWIRLEVVAPGEVNSAPVAVPDQVKLRANRVVNVDVLANDIDLDGDTLAVTNVEVASTDGSTGTVRASVVDRRMVQVEVVPGPNGEPATGPFTISYRTVDGLEADRAGLDRPRRVEAAEEVQSRGAITVLVLPPKSDQPPILLPDEVVVRTGDISSVAVLRNDVDPDSDEISLVAVDPKQAEALEANDQAVAWVRGREVFVQGGAKPGRYSILYTVEAGGREASSEVSIVVKPAVDDKNNPNQAPKPVDLVARAVRNNTIRVKVPLTGVDPDGDSVELIDQLSTPEQGKAGNRAVLDPENPDTILFTATPKSGPIDSFTYRVRDRFGLEGVGTVKVMVLDDGGWAPQAHDDVWRGVPGRTLSIPVVANDSSPQDRRLEIAEQPYFDSNGQPSASPVNTDAVTLLDQADAGTRGRIEVKVPIDNTTLSEHYRITDGFNPSDAFIRVTPDPNTPNIRPIAQTDQVPVADVRNTNLGDPVVVDVLRNDYDPDDAATALRYSVPVNQPATFDADGRLAIPVTENPQIVLYRISDADGADTIGIVHVPGRENHPPVLNELGLDSTSRTIEADANNSVTIRVADVTDDPDGDPEIALTDTEIRVVGGVGEVKRLDDGTGFVYTPPALLAQTTNVSISFEVTDRPNVSADQRQKVGCNCLSSLSIGVVVIGSSPPRVLSAGALNVPQLNEPQSIDVAPLSTDDDGDPLTYAFDAGTFGGLDVQQNGSRLTITANGTGANKFEAGRQITIRYTISDGKFDPVSNVVVVTIVKTNKGQPATGVLGPFEAIRDEPYDLPNLLDAAVNPFAADGYPLTLANYSVSQGAELSCSESGQCQFVSTNRKIRQFTVDYTIKDALDQTANGSFEITVKGLPLAPGAPRIESVGDHVVNLSWTAADLQGGEFKTYHVTAEGGGQKFDKTFDQTGGAFDGLQNATAYTFTVTAENELGLGETSKASSVGIPDRVPDPPVGLVFTDYQDQTLAIEWSPPPTADDFSAIIQYEIAIGGQRIKVGGGVTSLVVGLQGQGEALQNGTDYSFKVRAQNSAKTDAGWGAWSTRSANTERPSRQPDPPTNVRGSNSGDGGNPRITVVWDAPAFDGGRPLTGYRVCRAENGECQNVGSGTQQATFGGLGRGESSTYTVVAINSDKNRSDSDASAASAAVIAVGNPDPPVVSAAGSGDKYISVNYSGGNNSGCTAMTTEVSIDGGATWQTDTVFSGLRNGTTYTVIGRNRLASSCGTPGQTYISANSNAVSQTPYGPLNTPSISASGSGTTTIKWSWNTNRGDDGRPGWTATLSGDCGSQTVKSATGSVSKTFSRDGSTRRCTITVSAPGMASKSDSASATVQKPAPTEWKVTVSAGGEPVCPEPDFSAPFNFDSGSRTCNHDGMGWIKDGSKLVVSCYRSVSGSGWTYKTWARIKSGGPGYGYIPKSLLSGSMSGMPAC